LINHAPRAASIVASSDSKLLTLDRLSFKRILGPIENILKRNSETYIKYIKN
jgi:cAMP-dependent protein kinase regulator